MILSEDVDGVVDRPRVGRRLEMSSPLSNVAFYFKTRVRHSLMVIS